MRGTDDQAGRLLVYADLEARVRRDHPLRAIQAIVNEALSFLAPGFSALYSKMGRPSIPRRSACCAPCFCRPFTRCVPSGN